MRTRGLAILAATCLLSAGLLAGCAQQEGGADMGVAAEATADAAAAPAESLSLPAEEGIDNGTPDASQLASSANTQTDANRKFIRTAQVEFRVKNVYQSALSIEDMVAAHGGFVAKNHTYTQVGQVRTQPKGDNKLLELAEYTVRGELTVRVPSERTQEFLRALVGQMEFLDGRNFEARDAQFELLRQRLAWQRNQEAQQDIGDAVDDGGKLGQKADAIAARNNAKSARDEALIVQKEFEDRVAFSTIDLSLYQAPRVRQTERVDTNAVFDAHGPSFISRIGDALRSGWHGGLTALVVIAHLWPLWLAVALLVFGWRWWRWKRKPIV